MFNKRNFLLLCLSFLVLNPVARAQYADWKHSGSFYILTTPEGADLPSTAELLDFPLLVRLHKDFFNFDNVRPQGEDIRFSSAEGKPLKYEIDQWDKTNGFASIWVRIPLIKGNQRQKLNLHW